MEFPNAHKGLRRIAAGAVLTVASVAGAAAATVLVLLMGRAGAPASAGAYKASGVLFTVSTVAAILGYLLYIAGAYGAAEDEPLFRRAPAYLIVGIAALLAAALIPNGGTLGVVASGVQLVCEFMAVRCMLKGVRSLADRAGSAPLKASADAAVRPVALLYAAMLVFFIASDAADRAAHAATASILLFLIDDLLSAAAAACFLRVLRQAEKTI